MARAAYTGKCVQCGRTMGKAAMTRHVDAHLRAGAVEGARGRGAARGKARGTARGTDRATDRGTDRATDRATDLGMHIVVDCPDAPMFWLHLDAPAEATLEDLDAFLRRTWLECCGHMSAFGIEGVSYETEPEESYNAAKGMDVALMDVLIPGIAFKHEYDFGTTTTLRLRVMSMGRGGPYRGRGWRRIRTLARNDPPRPVCAACGGPATRICAQCYGDLGAWTCDACAPDHECGEDMLLPFVNSPRCGVCGYTGEAW